MKKRHIMITVLFIIMVVFLPSFFSVRISAKPAISVSSKRITRNKAKKKQSEESEDKEVTIRRVPAICVGTLFT